MSNRFGEKCLLCFWRRVYFEWFWQHSNREHCFNNSLPLSFLVSPNFADHKLLIWRKLKLFHDTRFDFVI